MTEWLTVSLHTGTKCLCCNFKQLTRSEKLFQTASWTLFQSQDLQKNFYLLQLECVFYLISSRQNLLLCCSIANLCLTLCDPMDTRIRCPSLSVGVCSDSCPLSQWCYLTKPPLQPSSPFAFNHSQHQGLFQWVGSFHQVAKILELQLQHQIIQWIFKVDFL